MDDWDGLENRCGLEATVGSNPTLSAEYINRVYLPSGFLFYNSDIDNQVTIKTW